MIALALLFILSGAAGLIYESVWARYISLLVGHSAYAQVIVLVIFLGGMAIGSLVVGKWSQRIRSPLLWYAIIEAAIAVIALVFHPAFVAATNLAYHHVLPSLSAGAAVHGGDRKRWVSADDILFQQATIVVLPWCSTEPQHVSGLPASTAGRRNRTLSSLVTYPTAGGSRE